MQEERERILERDAGGNDDLALAIDLRRRGETGEAAALGRDGFDLEQGVGGPRGRTVDRNRGLSIYGDKNAPGQLG